MPPFSEKALCGFFRGDAHIEAPDSASAGPARNIRAPGRKREVDMREVLGWIVFMLLGGAVTCGRVEAEPVAIDGVIEAQMRDAGLVGLAAAVIIDGKVVWTRGYGFADRQSARRFTPDTVMNIGSISKVFTGVALMQAVEDGRLSLDVNVSSYLPFKVAHPAFPDQPITLRQLALHTSGISDRWEAYQRVYHWGGDSPVALGDFLRGYFTPGGTDYSAENFLAHAPGTHREYSNIGAALAGYIVERAVGQKLDVYTRKRIFAPLEMQRSGWLLSQIPRGAHATLYVAPDGWAVPIPPYGLTTYPDGGVRTSVADLSKFFIALLNGGAHGGARILTASSAAEMLRAHYTRENKPGGANLERMNAGFFWKYLGDVMGHGGSDPGVKTQMYAKVSKDVGVIWFCNTSLSEANGKAFDAIDAALMKYAEELKGAALPD
jgi:CubicO group peptidase (beta-lactamase class C family)